MKLNLLIIENNCSIREELQWVKSYLQDELGIEVYIDYKQTNVPLSFKNALRLARDGSVQKTVQGLGQILRNNAQANTYTIVGFAYGQYPTGAVGYAHSSLYGDKTLYFEQPISDWDKTYNREGIVHEIMHCLFGRARLNGIFLDDPMDTFPTMLGGVDTAIPVLKPHFNRIFAETPRVGLYGALISALTQLSFLYQKLLKSKQSEPEEQSHPAPPVEETVEKPTEPVEKESSVQVSPHGLLPEVHEKAEELLRRAEEKGYTLRITEGYRTPERQNELYAQGRTKLGKIITNAKAGESYHNYRVAFDVVDRFRGYDINWNEIGELGKSLGLEWGGDWSVFPDRPHFQYTQGRTIQELKNS